MKKIIIGAIMAMLTMAIMAISASAAPIDWTAAGITAASFTDLLDSVLALLPLILPVVLGLIAIKLGIKFFRGQMK